jgi:hypothetical protein
MTTRSATRRARLAILLTVMVALSALWVPSAGAQPQAVGQPGAAGAESPLPPDQEAHLQELMKSPAMQAIVDQWMQLDKFSGAKNPGTVAFEVPDDNTYVGRSRTGATQHMTSYLALYLEAQRGIWRGFQVRTTLYSYEDDPALFDEVYGAHRPAGVSLLFMTAMNTSRKKTSSSLNGVKRTDVEAAVHGERQVYNIFVQLLRTVGIGKKSASIIWNRSVRTIGTPRRPCGSCSTLVPADLPAEMVFWLALWGTAVERAESATLLNTLLSRIFTIRRQQRTVEARRVAATATREFKAKALSEKPAQQSQQQVQQSAVGSASASASAAASEPGQQAGPAAGCAVAGALGSSGSVSVGATGVLALGAAESCSGGNGLARALTAAADPDLGGVDLTTLELRYLSDDPSSGGLQYAFSGKPISDGQNQSIASGSTAIVTSAEDLRA